MLSKVVYVELKSTDSWKHCVSSQPNKMSKKETKKDVETCVHETQGVSESKKISKTSKEVESKWCKIKDLKQDGE